jgi:hypothetical protein
VGHLLRQLLIALLLQGQGWCSPVLGAHAFIVTTMSAQLGSTSRPNYILRKFMNFRLMLQHPELEVPLPKPQRRLWNSTDKMITMQPQLLSCAAQSNSADTPNCMHMSGLGLHAPCNSRATRMLITGHSLNLKWLCTGTSPPHM